MRSVSAWFKATQKNITLSLVNHYRGDHPLYTEVDFSVCSHSAHSPQLNYKTNTMDNANIYIKVQIKCIFQSFYLSMKSFPIHNGVYWNKNASDIDVDLLRSNRKIFLIFIGFVALHSTYGLKVCINIWRLLLLMRPCRHKDSWCYTYCNTRHTVHGVQWSLSKTHIYFNEEKRTNQVKKYKMIYNFKSVKWQYQILSVHIQQVATTGLIFTYSIYRQSNQQSLTRIASAIIMKLK